MSDLLINSKLTGGRETVKYLTDIGTAAQKAASSIDSFQNEINKLKKPTTVQNYNKEMKTLQKEAKNTETEIERLNKQLNNNVTQTKKASKEASKLSGFFKTIKAAAVGYATVLATMEIQQFVTNTIQAGVELDSLQRSFKAITGSAALAKEQMGFVSGIANDLGLELTSLEKSYKDILAASRGTALEGQNVQKVFLSINKAAAVLGMSSDDVQGSLRALSQMISKGNVQAKLLAVYAAMCILNPVNSGKLLLLKARTILSEARKGTCNDYPEMEYTQASGSAGHPKWAMI